MVYKTKTRVCKEFASRDAAEHIKDAMCYRMFNSTVPTYIKRKIRNIEYRYNFYLDDFSSPYLGRLECYK